MQGKESKRQSYSQCGYLWQLSLNKKQNKKQRTSLLLCSCLCDILITANFLIYTYNGYQYIHLWALLYTVQSPSNRNSMFVPLHLTFHCKPKMIVYSKTLMNDIKAMFQIFDNDTNIQFTSLETTNKNFNPWNKETTQQDSWKVCASTCFQSSSWQEVVCISYNCVIILIKRTRIFLIV